MAKNFEKTIQIPSQVKVSLDSRTLVFVGPKGTNRLDVLREEVVIELAEDEIKIKQTNQKRDYLNLYYRLILNCIQGVTEGFTKSLELVGVGYKASINGQNLVLNVGYSHPVVINKVEGIDFTVTDNTIHVSGIDKVKVGDMAAKIRSVRPPEPYKGKGIRYKSEQVYRKEYKSLK